MTEKQPLPVEKVKSPWIYSRFERTSIVSNIKGLGTLVAYYANVFSKPVKNSSCEDVVQVVKIQTIVAATTASEEGAYFATHVY